MASRRLPRLTGHLTLARTLASLMLSYRVWGLDARTAREPATLPKVATLVPLLPVTCPTLRAAEVGRPLADYTDGQGVHVNFFPLFNKEMDKSKLDESDLRNVERAKMWETWGLGYLIEHATKPATIGQVLESSPVAILAWYVSVDDLELTSQDRRKAPV